MNKFFVGVFVASMLTSSMQARAQEGQGALSGSEKWGMGPNAVNGGFSGLGIRWWALKKLGFDFNLDYDQETSGDNGRQWAYTLGIGALLQLKRTDHLRLLQVTGVSYSQINYYYYGSTYYAREKREQFSFDLGLGAEYSFSELPQISFGAFGTGLGLELGKRYGQRYDEIPLPTYQVARAHNTEFSMRPKMSLVVRYYFK